MTENGNIWTLQGPSGIPSSDSVGCRLQLFLPPVLGTPKRDSDVEFGEIRQPSQQTLQVKPPQNQPKPLPQLFPQTPHFGPKAPEPLKNGAPGFRRRSSTDSARFHFLGVLLARRFGLVPFAYYYYYVLLYYYYYIIIILLLLLLL